MRQVSLWVVQCVGALRELSFAHESESHPASWSLSPPRAGPPCVQDEWNLTVLWFW